MAGLPVAVLDADVLVPILSCDLLLSSFDHGLYQPVVTRRILDEVTRSLAVDFPALDRPAIASRVRQALVPPSGSPTPGSSAVSQSPGSHVADPE